ncbi:MAG: GNAT family N-acetyltransferase [Alphaproteobacteria bacterium]|nr:GNAT family N-acetyltransferase [Alphaproteobacteria bacterium]
MIKTHRLQIRKTKAKDWKSIKEIWTDFDLSAYAKYDRPHHLSNVAVRTEVKKQCLENKRKNHLFYVVLFRQTVIGYFDFHNTGDGYDCGYCFLSSYHGKGFAREGFQTLLELLNKKGVKKFTAGTALDNAPSVKLLLSLGFKLTGTERVSFYKDTSNAEISFDGGRYELTPAERISISAFPSRSSAPHTI